MPEFDLRDDGELWDPIPVAGSVTARSCEIAGCDAPPLTDLPLCRTHWRSVPDGVRREVRGTWRAWVESRGPIEDYDDACARAVEQARQEALF